LHFFAPCACVAELDDLGFDSLLGVRDDLLLREVVGHGLELVLLKLDGLLVDADNLGRRPLDPSPFVVSFRIGREELLL